MADTKINEKTAEINPLESIKDPILKSSLSRLRESINKNEFSKDFEEFKKEIIKKPVQPEQQIFSFLPHQMAKTSIFFPMSDKELKTERRIIDKIEHDTNWGKIVIEGIKLAIFEEDILLALLFLARDNHKKFNNDFILETNLNRIINIIYGRQGYSKKNEEVILKCLKHFELVSFDLIVGEWKKKGKERLKIEKTRSIGSIITGYYYDHETKQIKIYFNPHFFTYFLDSMLSNINLSLRRKLKKDGSKAILRFISTHNEPGNMHILTLLNAINFNINQPMFKIRQLFKAFIKELKSHHVLGSKTKLGKDDIVFLDVSERKKPTPV